MSIQFVTRHMCLSMDCKNRVAQLCSAVIRCYPNVLHIRVVLDDINGPYKAGNDTRCHLTVRGRDHLRIDIDKLRTDVWQSVDSAFGELWVRLVQCKRRGRKFDS
jgi:ribosome-associated translation inhibitor RaiA